jgi:hypothetical protein
MDTPSGPVPNVNEDQAPLQPDSISPQAPIDNGPQVFVYPPPSKNFFSRGPKVYAALAFVLIFAGCGVYALLSSFAATPSVTKTWSTAADWNAATLSSAVVSGNSVVLPVASTGGGTSGNPGTGSGTGSGGGTTTGTGSTSGSTAPFGTCTKTLSGQWDQVAVSNNVELQINKWNSSAPFSICTDGGPHFKIVNSSIAPSNYIPSVGDPYGPGAYPSLFVGCHTVCTPNSGLPLAVSAMTGGGKVLSSYSTSTSGATGGNKWDDAYDIWFSDKATSNAPGYHPRLEMMVWLNWSGGADPGCATNYGQVKVGNYTFNACADGARDRVDYQLATQGTSVSNLDIGLLAKDSLQRGLLQNSWVLDDVEAGFEPYDGVSGLSVNGFSVTVNGTTAYNPSAAKSSSDMALAAATVTPSASNTVVLNNSGGTIIDGAGSKWTVSSGLVAKNGSTNAAGFTKNVVEIAYVNGTVWQENTSNLWWSWNGNNGWNGGNGIATSPVTGTGSGGGGTGGGTGSGSALSGTATLTFNAGGVATWNSLTDQNTTPSGTTLTTQARTSTDGTNWSAWTSSSNIAQATASQYLQIQVTLGRTSTATTPTLNSLSLTYTPQGTGGSGGGTGGGGGTGSGGLTVGSSAPPSGTNAVVDFRTNLNVPALNTYSIGDTLSTYGSADGSTINTSANYRNTLAALGPLAWRVPLRNTNGTPTGAGAGGGGTGYVQNIKAMNGVPVVIASGQTGDNDFNDSQIQSLANYYNANGGQNGGPVTAWIIGNEPGINNSGVNGDPWTDYKNRVPGAISAIQAGSAGVKGLTFSVGTVFTQGLISNLSQVAGDSGVTYLSWHGYEIGDNNGNNSAQYVGPVYAIQEAQAQAIAATHGEQSGIEEFNWNSACPGSSSSSLENELGIASVIGNILTAGGSHAYMYSDTNGNSGCNTVTSSNGNAQQQAPYWALGMWTGMNGQFDRFGNNLVDTKVNGIDITSASARENSGLQHEVELFATNNGKILAINKNTSTNESITIGVGGLTSGHYNIWQTNKNNVVGSAGAPIEVTKGANFSGSTITVTLPAGTMSSIDVSN